ncbi:2,3-diphosphoglycerate-dependent phosphoglycerate mutase [Rhodococcus sp. NPDC127530]|uniref:2,3-bisphosphoglycerate-dependent phosphoglycerate mutase n=1 Tax=unclassified Rhodococcus (in: high G+C Gram-positive bacteria) TaxID=192944 RepID=UPI0036458526
MHSRLILLRHAQSEWNALDRFAGWVDVGLTADGREGATRAGTSLACNGIHPGAVHTSLLRRSIATAALSLDAAQRQWIPVRRSWRLNERHYGALQGRKRSEVVAEFGADQTALWRRSYRSRPPMLSGRPMLDQRSDPRYADVASVPVSESLCDVHDRVVPYYRKEITASLRSHGTVLVVSHGNTLRALIKHLDRIPDGEIDRVEVPIGVPLLYELGEDLMPAVAGGVFLGT